MSWATAGSAIFRQFVADSLSGTADIQLKTAAHTFNVALYSNTSNPDKDVAAAASAYNTGVWTTSGTQGANEVYMAGQWPAGGQPGAGMAITTPSTGVIMFDMTDTASVGSSATLANVYGSLLYDFTVASPVAKQGVCFNYFGGANSVTAGTLTIVWHANGLFRITV